MSVEMSFSIKEALRFGWTKTKERIGFYISLLLIAVLVLGVLLILFTILSGSKSTLSQLLGWLMYILYFVVAIVIGIGIVKISTQVIEGKQPTIADLFSHYHYFWKYMGVSILYMLIVYAGLILLIIPGIIWAIKYQFVYYLVIDKNMGITEAFKASKQMTAQCKGKLFWMYIVFGLISFVGILALFVGTFITTPIVMLAYAYVYKKLLPKAQMGNATRSEERRVG